MATLNIATECKTIDEAIEIGKTLWLSGHCSVMEFGGYRFEIKDHTVYSDIKDHYQRFVRRGFK